MRSGERDSMFFVLAGSLVAFACLDAVAFSYAAKSVPSMFLSLFLTVLGVPVFFFCYWFFEVRHNDPSCRGGRQDSNNSRRLLSAAKSRMAGEEESNQLGQALLFDSGSDCSVDHHQDQHSSNSNSSSRGDGGGGAAGSELCSTICSALAPPEALRRNFVPLVVFGLLSTVSSAMVIIGGSRTAGGMQALLYQLIIPFNVLLSAVILKHRASASEYGGAAVVLCGIIVVYLPQILPGKNAQPVDSSTLLFNMIYAAGIVPSSLTSILSERALKTWEGVTVLGFAAWLQLVSLPMTLLTVPLYTLPFLGDNRVPWAEIGDSYDDGFRCLVHGGDDVQVVEPCKWGK